jgi:hypothetical protein
MLSLTLFTDMVDRLNTLSTFVEGIDSNAIDLNIQDEQDVAFFNEWMAQLSTNIGQGDDTLGLQLNPSLSNAVYQDASVTSLPNYTEPLGEAASYGALFANPDIDYSNVNASPYDIDQNIMSSSNVALYPTAGESQYVHSKPRDDYNVSAGYPSLRSAPETGRVGIVGQRQHYSNTPSIAPTYFMPNMNVSLNYGRSNGADELNYGTLARLRTPRADNSIEIQPEKDDHSLPTKEEVTHERKKNVQTVLSQMAGRKQSSKFTSFIQYITPAKMQSENANASASRGINPSQNYEPHSQPTSPVVNGLSTYPVIGDKTNQLQVEDDTDSNVDILTRNMDKVHLEDDQIRKESGVSGSTSLYPTSSIGAGDSDPDDIETRRKHLLVLQRLYQLVATKYPKIACQSENDLVSSPRTVPAQ